MIEITALVGLVAVALAASYLITVGVTWVTLWLVALTFGATWDVNVWALGGLVWIAFWVLRGIFKTEVKK